MTSATPDLKEFKPQVTADGSFTFISHEFGELFHSHFGAKQESFLKFVAPTGLETSAVKPSLRILDICYGLGYNTAAALQTIWAVNPHCNVELIGLELNPSVPQAAIAHGLFDNWHYEYTGILTQLAVEKQVKTSRFQGKLLIGDGRNLITQVHQSGFLADAIFLDPFSPPRCPQLWTVEFMQKVAGCLDPQGLLATYSCAAAVRTALLAAGLEIGSTPPVGRRSPGTIAGYPRYRSVNSFPPLCESEKEHLQTRAGVPYRDPQLIDSADVILKRRNQEQEVSPLEPTSSWRKRWFSGK